MKAVLQRVKNAAVNIDGKVFSRINRGLLVLLGVEEGDEISDAQYIVDKCVELRIFEDDAGKMNLSVKDLCGDIMVVSQFTLLADCKKGRRPSFICAAKPVKANALYEITVDKFKQSGLNIETGRFAADMEISLINEGPVTIILDSRR